MSPGLGYIKAITLSRACPIKLECLKMSFKIIVSHSVPELRFLFPENGKIIVLSEYTEPWEVLINMGAEFAPGATESEFIFKLAEEVLTQRSFKH